MLGINTKPTASGPTKNQPLHPPCQRVPSSPGAPCCQGHVTGLPQCPATQQHRINIQTIGSRSWRSTSIATEMWCGGRYVEPGRQAGTEVWCHLGPQQACTGAPRYFAQHQALRLAPQSTGPNAWLIGVTRRRAMCPGVWHPPARPAAVGPPHLV